MSKRRTGAYQRDRVIAKYGQRCWWCFCETVIVGTRINEEIPPWNSFTVDHFIPIAKGGSNELDNLRPSCRACNELKGDEIWDDQLSTSRHLFEKRQEWENPTLADLWPEQ